MNKKKGFTFVELIASIAILAVILVMVTISYTQIKKNVLEAQYKNVKTVIEQAGIRYSSKNGYFAFFVQELIDEGYIEPDDEVNIYDPRNDESLNCHIVMISEDRYGNLKAKLQEEDHSRNGVCDISDLDAYPSLLKINATLMNTDYEYESNKTLYDPNLVYPLIYDGWTKSRLTLTLDMSRITEPIDGYTVVWNNDQTTNTDSINTPDYSIFSSYYYADLFLPSSNQYQARKKIKIDNENPVIYHQKTRISSATSNNEWTRNKTIIIYATDKDGVGLDRIYVGDEPCSALQTNRSLGQPAIPGPIQTYLYTEDVGSAGKNVNVCAIDKLGNLAEGGSITVSKIDTIAPTCSIGATGIQGNGEWFKAAPSGTAADSKVTLSLTRSDGTGGSGVSKYFISATKTGSPAFSSNSATFNVTSNTPKAGKTYYGYVRDAAGNIGSCEKHIYLDMTLPTIKVKTYKTAKSIANYDGINNPNNYETTTYTNQDIISIDWNNVGHRVIINATDALSGFSEKETASERNLKYQYNGGDKTAFSDADLNAGSYYNIISGQDTSANFGPVNNGYRYSVYTVCDDAGNCRASKVQEKIDKVKPTAVIKGYNYLYPVNTGGTNACPDSSNKCDYQNTQTPAKTSPTLTDGGVLEMDWNSTGTVFWVSMSDTGSKIYSIERYINNKSDYDTWDDTWNPFTASKHIYSVPDHYANPVSAANHWLTVTPANTTTNGEGKRQFKIIVKDTAGNVSTFYARSPISTRIACSLNITGTKGEGDWYKSGSVDISLSYVAPATVNGVLISTTNTSSPSYKTNTDANKVVTRTDNTSSSGVTYYGYVKDTAGNKAKCSVKVYLDHTPPTCSYGPTVTTWARGYRTLTVGCTDSHSGCDPDNDGSSYRVGKNLTTGETYNDTPTITTYNFNTTIKDNAGNSTICNKTGHNILVDNTPPTITQNAYEYAGVVSNGNYGTAVNPSPYTNKNLSVASFYDGNWNNTGHYFVYDYKDVHSGLDKAELYVNTAGDYGTYGSFFDSNGNLTGSPASTSTHSGEVNTVKTKANQLTAAGLRAQLIKVYDKAGNSRYVISYTAIDKSAPKLTTRAYAYVSPYKANTKTCNNTNCDYKNNRTVVSSTTGSEMSLDWNNTGHAFIIQYSEQSSVGSKNMSGLKSITWQTNPSGTYQTLKALSGTASAVSHDSSLYSGYTTADVSLTTAGWRQGKIVASDRAGNVREVEIDDKIDKTAPTATFDVSEGTAGTNGWYIGSKVTLKLNSITDNSQSGVKCYFISTTNYDVSSSSTNLPSCPSSSSSSKSITESTAKTGTTYYAYIRDNAGNWRKYSKVIKFEKEAASCTLKATSSKATVNGFYKDDVVIAFNTTSVGISGQYRANITTTSNYTASNLPAGSSSVTHTNDTAGTTYYGYILTNAGNFAKCSKSIKKDTVAPQVSQYGFDYVNDNLSSYNLNNPKKSNTNGSVSMSYSTTGAMFIYKYRDGVSGVYTRKLYVNSSGDYSTNPYPGENSDGTINMSATATYTYSTPVVSASEYETFSNKLVDAGARLQAIQLCDYAGNCRTIKSYVAIDKSSPTCSLSISGTKGNGSWYISQPTITISGLDTGFGIGNKNIDTSSSNPSTWGNTGSISSDITETTTSGRTYYGHVKDKAGNTASCNIKLYFDKTPPTVTLSMFPYSSTNGTNYQNYTSGAYNTVTHSGAASSNSNLYLTNWKTSPAIIKFTAKDLTSNNIGSDVGTTKLYINTAGQYGDPGASSIGTTVARTYTKSNDYAYVSTTSGYVQGYRFGTSGSSDGYRYGRFDISDVAGNVTQVRFRDMFDTVAPTCNPYVRYKNTSTTYTPSTIGGNWSNKRLWFYHGCDDSGTGLQSVRWTPLSQGTSNLDYTSTMTFTSAIAQYREIPYDEMITGMGVVGCDIAGNCMTYSKCVGCNATDTNWNDHVLSIDTVAPTITATASDSAAVSGTHKSNVTYTFTCEENYSGRANHGIKCNGSNCGTTKNNDYTIIYLDSSQLTVGGTTTVTHECTDNANNKSTATYNITVQSGSNSNSCINVTIYDKNGNINFYAKDSDCSSGQAIKVGTSDWNKTCRTKQLGCNQHGTKTKIGYSTYWVEEEEFWKQSWFRPYRTKTVCTPGSSINPNSGACENMYDITFMDNVYCTAQNVCSTSDSYYRYEYGASYETDGYPIYRTKCTRYNNAQDWADNFNTYHSYSGIGDAYTYDVENFALCKVG